MVFSFELLLFCVLGDESISGGTACIFGNDIRLHPKAARRHVFLAISFCVLYILMRRF